MNPNGCADTLQNVYSHGHPHVCSICIRTVVRIFCRVCICAVIHTAVGNASPCFHAEVVSAMREFFPKAKGYMLYMLNMLNMKPAVLARIAQSSLRLIRRTPVSEPLLEPAPPAPLLDPSPLPDPAPARPADAT
jgi:hypothetical protein